MAKTPCIAIIIEGNRREKDYFSAMKKKYFKTGFEILPLPANQNIYMLWNRMKDDSFQTDIIEVLRESNKDIAASLDGRKRSDFQEVYLFFDFDPQQKNLGANSKEETISVLKSMMESFNNETENGKLYISYPMIEALRDIKDQNCEILMPSCTKYLCTVSTDDGSITCYKKNSAGKYDDVRHYSQNNTWEMILSIFLTRCKCLFEVNEQLLSEWYKREIAENSTHLIMNQQLSFMEERNIVFVLSAFPEFILDYFPLSYFPRLNEDVKKISTQNCILKNND